jgi:hypothetical protein
LLQPVSLSLLHHTVLSDSENAKVSTVSLRFALVKQGGYASALLPMQQQQVIMKPEGV